MSERQVNIKPVGVILGHSFPKSLKHHIYHKFITVDKNVGLPFPVYCAHFLRVSNKYDSVHFYGDGGAKVLETFKLPSYELKAIRPTVACLDIGSNDLIQGYQPVDIATGIVTLAKTLRDEFNCKEIRVFSVLNRSVRQTDPVSQEVFDNGQYNLNGYLSEMCSKEVSITYQVHDGFWKTADSQPLFVHEWSRDCIHPNLDLGRKNYIRSVTSALLHGRRDAHLRLPLY